MPNGFFHFESWTNPFIIERDVLQYLMFLCSLIANSTDPNYTSHSVTSDVGL